MMRYCRECTLKMGAEFPYPLEELPIRNIDRKPKGEGLVPDGGERRAKKAKATPQTGQQVTLSALEELLGESYECEPLTLEAAQEKGREHTLLICDVCET